VLVEARLPVLPGWSSKGSSLLVLALLSVGEEEVPPGGWQAGRGLTNIKAQPQIAGVWYAEAKSNGSSWGEMFSTGYKNESAVHGIDYEVFSLVER